MGLPDQRGRADIFEHYLRPLKLAPQLTPDRLAADLASAAQGLTGADIAYLCQRATMFCVKDAVRAGEVNEGIGTPPLRRRPLAPDHRLRHRRSP
jgi:SpoVK/Ycf46/Vps4 family AAA+-type ATPase